MQLPADLNNIIKSVMAGLLALIMLSMPAAVAQDAAISSRNVPMNIQPGQEPSTVNGLVAGDTRLVHSVRIAAGQRLNVELRSNNPDLVFGIYARSGAAVFEARRGQRSFSAVLRRPGTYAVIVSFTERARRKNALYQLTIGLSDRGFEDNPEPPISPVEPPREPPIERGDLVRVVGIGANDTLAVRDGPGSDFEIIGELSPGTRRLRLGNCRQRGASNWCSISTTRSVPISGWVNARFLSEDNS
jgi:uncharacterized protein YraI